MNDRSHARIDIEIDVFARVLGAQVDIITFDQEPPGLVLREFIEHQADDCLAFGKILGMQPALQFAHQELHIELIIGELVASPTHTPGGEDFDQRSEFTAGRGQAVFIALLAGQFLPDDDSAFFEMPEPPDQQRR